jgi:hypothetical protein
METLKLKKRRQQRLVARCAIEFVVNGQTFIGLSSNISLGGLFIRSRNYFAPGTIMDMSVHLPDGSMSKLRGRVARVLVTGDAGGRSLENGMGVAIIEKDHNYVHVIASLLSVTKS